MTETTLNFPETAKSAAIEQVKKWHHDPDKDKISGIECDLANEFGEGEISYGIEDALLSGKRIRLLDDIGITNKKKLNCGEVGINVFLIYSALGLSKEIKLLRYNSDHESDHFAVLHYDQGFEEDPWIVDPLWGFFGRIKLLKDGFIYYPTNWLNDKENQKPKGETITLTFNFGEEESVSLPRKIKAEYMFLSQEDVIRHVNYINSPLGFFDYLKTGQKIRCEKKNVYTTDFTTKTIDDTLKVWINLYDNAIDLFTIERTYSIKNNNLVHKDKHMLNLNFNWVEPNQIIYEITEGKETLHRLNKKSPEAMAFVAYARAAMQSKDYNLFELTRSCMWVHDLNNRIKRWEEELKDVNPVRIREDGVTEVNFDRYDEEDELKFKIESLNEILAFGKSMDTRRQRTFAETRLFLDDYRNRKVKVEKPFINFKSSENPLPFLRWYTQQRYGMIKNKIDDFFASKTMEGLLTQYQEAMEIKSIVDAKPLVPVH